MTRTSTGAPPMPKNGRRALSPNAAQNRQRILECLRKKGSECQGQIFVNLFFDGTGNNRDWNGVFIDNPRKTRSTQTQFDRNGHSNVARLFDASFDEPRNGLFRFYAPGVGTPFPEIGDENQDGSMLGAGAALYGADRIHWAIIEVINAVHRYLTGARLVELDIAKTLIREMSRTRPFEGHVRRSLLSGIARNLERAVKKDPQRKVRSLDIAVFGFSRGAAQARAFAHRLFEIAQVWGSGCGHNIGGVPMRLNFMGLFETVASVGVAGISRVADGKMDWADGEMMSIHPEVRRCVHFVALHEQRINFPVDLATTGKEVLYPGMHSDVGGGYTPGSQGKEDVDGRVEGTAKISQIPLIDMHHAAFEAGVPLRTIDELAPLGDVAMHFACHPQLVRDYNAWLSGHGLPAGAHTQQIRAHCQQYVRWKGKRLWQGDENLLAQPFFQRADSEDQYDLNNAQQDFGNLVARYAEGKSSLLNFRQQQRGAREKVLDDRSSGKPATYMYPSQPSPQAYEYLRLSADTRALLDDVINKAEIPDASERLFDNYLHDSLAGFYLFGGRTELNMPVLATNGYLRYREVFSINSSVQPQVCVDPLNSSLPPVNVPSIDQVFGDMGRAMGGF